MGHNNSTGYEGDDGDDGDDSGDDDEIGSSASSEVPLIRVSDSLKKPASFKLVSVLNLPVLEIKD
jgi:hypothetical protein